MVSCDKCKTAILPQDHLCLYDMGEKSIHLILKYEQIHDIERRGLLKKDRILCTKKDCPSLLASPIPFGPHSAKAWSFSPRAVSVSGRTLKRKERLHQVCNEAPFSSLNRRNFDNFFGYDMCGESSSPKRIKLEESQPIVFPDPQKPGEFSYEDILLSDKTPYDYQLTAYIEALQRDLIVVLPTNYGKTLIASLVAAKMQSLNPDSMVLFIVDRIPLVFQQGEAISFDTHLQVYLLTRELHNIKKQEKLLNGEYEVLVATAGAYLSLRGKLGIDKFCYIIFDECHHATKGHDYVKILKLIKECDPSIRPRVLGLTASPPSAKGSEEANINLLNKFQSEFFNAPICHNLNLESQEKDDATIKMEVIQPHPDKLEKRIKLLKKKLVEREKVINELLEFPIIKCGKLDSESDHANFKRIMSLNILKDTTDKEVKSNLDLMEKIYEVLESNELLGATYADSVLEDIYDEFYLQEASKELCSSRLSTLLRILDEQQDSKIIVFVQTRKLAHILCTVLKGIERIDKKYSPLKIVGQYGLLGMSWEDEQEEVIKTFTRGGCNLLVSTSVLEEGLDVPCCDVVIRFDGIRTLTSYKQSRGRARKWENSKFILILSEREQEKYNELRKEEMVVKKVLDEHFTNSQVPSSRTLAIRGQLISAIQASPHSDNFAIKSYECAVELYLSGTHELHDIGESIASLLREYHISLRHIDLADPGTDWKSRGLFPAQDSLLILGLDSRSRGIYEKYKQLTVKWEFRFEEVSQNIWMKTEIPPAERKDKVRSKWPITKLMWGRFKDRSTFLVNEVERFEEINAHFELITSSHILLHIPRGFVIHIPLASIHRFILTDWRIKNMRLYIPLTSSPEIRTGAGDRQTCDTNTFLSYYGENPVVRLTIPYDKSDWSQLWVFLHSPNVFPVPLFESRVENPDMPNMDTNENLLNTPSYWNETMQDCVWLFSILKTNRNVCVSDEIVNRISNDLSNVQVDDLIEHKYALSGLLILISDVKTHYFVELEHAFTEQLDYARKNPLRIPRSKCENNYCYIECAMVTPSRVVPLHPILNQCNRLYRRFPSERFLNLAFREENGEELDKKEQVLNRVKNIMENGIEVSGAKFYFLVCSSSQLRSKRAIFIHLRDTETDVIQRKINDIRFQLLGSCDIKNETKFLSRLGLFCTSDQPALEIQETETHCLPDLKATNGLLLTDGAGKIRRSLAKRALEEIGSESTVSTTSALQVRLAGLKGVLTIVDDSSDPDFNGDLQHCKLLYRKSMKKIEWTHSTLCIVKVSKFNKLFLNVQMLNLLTSLQDRSNIWDPKPKIKALHCEALHQFARIFTDTEDARKELGSNLPAYFNRTSALQLFDILCEPFFLTILRCIYTHNVKNLIERVHIPIPVEDGCILMGIPDPVGVLGDGEVFITYQLVSEKDEIFQGRVLTYKNPCLHPGDLLTPTAVDRPELRFLHNVIVFPIKGSTSLPACSGGGDLDGDEFAIIWNPQLIPPETAIHAPLNYDEIAEPYKEQLAGKSADLARVQDDPDIQRRLTEGFCRVISNDLLGIISHYHLAICDQKSGGARDLLSVELAKTASLAVDSPKTGIIPEIPPEAKSLINEVGYPDFMEKRDKTSYRSAKLMGDLYHAAREICYQRPGWTDSSEDCDLGGTSSLMNLFNIPGYSSYMDEAQLRYFEYSSAFQQIMLAFGVESEAEVVTSLIIRCHPLLSADKGKTKNCLEASFQRLAEQFRETFHRDTPSSDYHKKAAAWYLTVYQSPRKKGDIVLHSFAWLVPEHLCGILSEHKRNILTDQTFSILGESAKEYVLTQSEFLRANVESKLSMFPIIESAIEHHISRTYPKEGKLFECFAFGSTSVYLCELQSDLDVSIELTDHGKSFFPFLDDCELKEQQKSILSHISPAIFSIALDQTNKLGGEVPYISLTLDPKKKKQSEVSVDITFKSNGVQKSDYIRQLYKKGGGVFFAWLWLLVHWARHVGILKCHNSPQNSGIILTAEFEALVFYIHERMGVDPEPAANGEVDCSLASLLDSIESENNVHMLGVMLEKFFWRGYELTSSARKDIVYTWPIEGRPTHTISTAALERISVLLFQGWHSLVFTRDVKKLFERVQTEFTITKRFSRRISDKIKKSTEFYRNTLANFTGAMVKIQSSGKHMLLTGYGSASMLHKLSAEISSIEADTARTKKYRSNANRYMIEGCVKVVMVNGSQGCKVKLGSFSHGCSKLSHDERNKNTVLCADQEVNTNWECEGITAVKSLLCSQLSRFPTNKVGMLGALRLKSRIGFFYVLDGGEIFKVCGNSLNLDELQEGLVKDLKYRKDIMTDIDNMPISDASVAVQPSVPAPQLGTTPLVKPKERKRYNKTSSIYSAFCPGVGPTDNRTEASEAAAKLKRAIELCGFERFEKERSYSWRIEIRARITHDVRFNLNDQLEVIDATERPIIWLLATIVGDRRDQPDSDRTHDLRIRAEAAKPLEMNGKLCQSILKEPTLITIGEDGCPVPCESIKNRFKFIKQNIEATHYQLDDTLAKVSYGIEYTQQNLKQGRYYCELNLYHSKKKLIEIVSSGKSRIQLQELADKALKLSLKVSNTVAGFI